MHIEVTGQGAPLVMLHGWGMHGGVFAGLAQRLARRYIVHRVDLPGHGASARSTFTLDGIVSRLAARFEGPVHVLGWSLGGLVAQHWALRQAAQVQQLILVAGTPCFTRREDWPHGMSAHTLAQFGAELEHDPAATLRRFLALQLRGSAQERELLAALRAQLASRAEPDMAALRGGLDILREADLRADLPQLKQPVLLIAGGRDRLTPPQASHAMAAVLPQARLLEIDDAAHVPFLSHAEICASAIEDFLHE